MESKLEKNQVESNYFADATEMGNWSYEKSFDIKYNQYIFKIGDENFKEIMTVWTGRPVNPDSIIAEMIANRVVACVNAFQGIGNPQEYIEKAKKVNWDHIETIEKERREFRRERDELKILLEQINDLLSSGHTINKNSLIANVIRVYFEK